MDFAWRHRGLSLARRGGRAVLDLIYPPICLACEAPVVEPDTLCSACFVALRPITAPFCPVLGLPFSAFPGEGALSAEAVADPPPFARARSAVLYNDLARTVVSRLKYADRPEIAAFCGRLMIQAGSDILEGRPLLVPVPLHPRRFLMRRYNQSGELAMVIGRIAGIAVDAGLVRRIRRTRQQVGLTHDGRERNVLGAFAPHPDFLVRLAGRRVVLVDDVYTTGATLKAVTRTLTRAGADHIDVLSFARVVSAGELPI